MKASPWCVLGSKYVKHSMCCPSVCPDPDFDRQSESACVHNAGEWKTEFRVRVPDFGNIHGQGLQMRLFGVIGQLSVLLKLRHRRFCKEVRVCGHVRYQTWRGVPCCQCRVPRSWWPSTRVRRVRGFRRQPSIPFEPTKYQPIVFMSNQRRLETHIVVKPGESGPCSSVRNKFQSPSACFLFEHSMMGRIPAL
jgi:hypothetical protein